MDSESDQMRLVQFGRIARGLRLLSFLSAMLTGGYSDRIDQVRVPGPLWEYQMQVEIVYRLCFLGCLAIWHLAPCWRRWIRRGAIVQVMKTMCAIYA